MSARISQQEIADETAHYHQNNSPAIIAGSIVLIVVATLAVVLRLVSRRMTRLQLAVDDYMIMLALLFAYGMFVSILFCAHYGLGKHIIRVGPSNAIKVARALYVLEAIYPACTGSTKLSILLLYRRIFTTHNSYFKFAMYTVAAVLACWAVAGFFTTIFQCWPVHTIWDHSEDQCIELVPALVGLAVINTVLNGAVLILPIPMLWTLRITLHQKVGVCGIFMLGSADVISSIIRTYLNSRLNITDVDVTWIETSAATLAFVEPCVGIICSCLPVTRVLFTTILSPIISAISMYRSSRPRGPKLSNRSASSHTAVAHESQEDIYPLNQYPGGLASRACRGHTEG